MEGFISSYFVIGLSSPSNKASHYKNQQQARQPRIKLEGNRLTYIHLVCVLCAEA